MEVRYDESHYPASAESDGESDHTSLVIENQQKPGSSEDFTCSVCAQVLLDPLTLHCGHSFCQLCLASVWSSRSKAAPKNLQCPVCRLPWRNFPGINILLRNVIESNHSEVIADRRSELTSNDRNLLNEFSSAKKQSWQSERHEGNQRLGGQEMRLLIICLIVTVFFIVGCIVILFALGIWVGSGAGGAFMRKPVNKWTNQDVLGWLGGLGKWSSQYNVSLVFQNEGITGTQLLLLDKDALESIGIHSAYRQEVLLQAIEDLRTGDLTPRNLQEFKAAYRKLSLILVILYKLWPRFTFGYIYLFAHEGIFAPVLESLFQITPLDDGTYHIDWSHFVVFVIEVLLIPHFVVGSFAWAWFGVNPWLAAAVIVHCFRATVSDVKTVLSTGLSLYNWRALVARYLRDFVINVMKFIAVLLLIYGFWPLTPHFICDLLFYLVIWHSVYSVFIIPLFKWRNIFNFRLQHNIRVEHNFN